MRGVTYLALALLRAGLSHAYYAFRVGDTGTCSQSQIAVVEEEIAVAYNLVKTAAAGAGARGTYYNDFFASSLRQQDGFEAKVNGIYDRFRDLFDESDPHKGLQFSIICDNSAPKCRTGGYYAAFNPRTNFMNFCDRFFDTNGEIRPSVEIKNNCDTISLRDVGRSRSFVVVHEMSHSVAAMEPLTATLDYAYGVQACKDLASGTFNRNGLKYAHPKKPLCPDANGVEGVCNAENSEHNADSWAFVAGGVGWSATCNRDIPYPACVTKRFRRSPSLSSKRECAPDDYIVIDEPVEDVAS